MRPNSALGVAVLGGNMPPWVMRGASADLNFMRSTYWAQPNSRSLATLISTSRASAGYAQTTSGLLVPFTTNTPRITDNGLLVEEARTNTSFGSVDLANGSYWSGFAMTGVGGQADPAGGTGAALISEDNTNANHAWGSVASTSYVLSTVYTRSFWLKAGTWNLVQLNLVSSRFPNNSYINVNLTTGAFSLGAGSTGLGGATLYPNGWVRVWLAGTCTSSGSNATANIYTIQSMADAYRPTFVGDPARNFYVFGSQVEIGPSATSLIITAGAGVARAADIITLTGAAATAALGAKAAYFETNGCGPNLSGNSARILAWSGGATITFNTSGTIVRAFNGTTLASGTIGSGGNYNGLVKSAFGMDAVSYTALANGGTKATEASAWAGNTGSVNVGNSSSGTSPLNGYLRRAVFGLTKGQFDGLTA